MELQSAATAERLNVNKHSAPERLLQYLHPVFIASCWRCVFDKQSVLTERLSCQSICVRQKFISSPSEESSLTSRTSSSVPVRPAAAGQ